MIGSLKIRKWFAVGTVCLAGCHKRPKNAVAASDSKLGSATAQLQTPVAVPNTGRQFGWDQLTKILTPDGAQPTWETWSSKCHLASDLAEQHPTWKMRLTSLCYTTQEADFNDSALNSTLESAQVTTQLGMDKSRAASVYFNSIAVQSINEGNWNLPAQKGGLDPLLPGPGRPTVQFKPGSIIVKAIWEFVNNEGQSWPLRVYDNSAPQWNTNSAFHPPQSLIPVESDTEDSGWKTMIHLDTDRSKTCPYQPGQAPSVVKDDTLVPINCFIAHKVTPAMAPVSMLGNTAGVRFSNDFYLVLVGLNISTREDETPNGWAFTTLWFTNNPDADKTRTDIPIKNRAWPYTQFAMNTSKDVRPVQNPYLEGPQGNTGMSSNCFSCHSLARIRVDPNGKVIVSNSTLGLPEKLPAPPDYSNAATTTGTDLVWAVTTARDSQSLTPREGTFAVRARGLHTTAR
jgi:hypothetical protein